MKRKGFKVVAVILTVILLVSVSVTSVAAGQGYDRGRRNVPTPEIRHLDAEVKVINGQPVIVVAAERGYVYVPFMLSGDVLVDGRAVPVRLQGNGLVVPTEGGPMVVALEEFELVVVGGGQLVLVAEVNPILTITLFAVGVKLGAKYLPVLAGVNADTTTKALGGAAGAATGGALGVALDVITLQWLISRYDSSMQIPMLAIVTSIVFIVIFMVIFIKLFPILAEIEPTPLTKLTGGMIGASSGFLLGFGLFGIPIGPYITPLVIFAPVLVNVIALVINRENGIDNEDEM